MKHHDGRYCGVRYQSLKFPNTRCEGSFRWFIVYTYISAHFITYPLATCHKLVMKKEIELNTMVTKELEHNKIIFQSLTIHSMVH
jgi:hypothetical protein